MSAFPIRPSAEADLVAITTVGLGGASGRA